MGIIEAAPNVPELSGLSIVSELQNKFRVPVFLGNDANLAALGEWKFGAGRGHQHMLYLTISTGIGSGVIIDGKLFAGARGFASELGHVLALSDGPVCSCGIRGHLEAISSGTAIAKWVTSQIKNGADSSIEIDFEGGEIISGAVIAEAARQGDALAIQAFKRAGKYLGQALANFLHIFNPTLIVLGGGVSQSYELFADELQAAMEAHVMIPEFLDELSIAIAELGDDIGLMGALALARESSC
jgi:glucokinase